MTYYVFNLSLFFLFYYFSFFFFLFNVSFSSFLLFLGFYFLHASLSIACASSPSFSCIMTQIRFFPMKMLTMSAEALILNTIKQGSAYLSATISAHKPVVSSIYRQNCSLEMYFKIYARNRKS